MFDYFKTTGKCCPLYNDDGTIKAYHVGTNKGTKHLSRDIPEYYISGNLIHIDNYGRPWLMK